jgi:carbonic anhydrase
MKRAWIWAVLACASLGCQSTARTPGPQAQWSYRGATGPDHWGDLSPEYVLAKTGKHQSPVDIATSRVVRKDASPLVLSYRPTSLEIMNNGHTVEDDYHGGGVLAIGGHEYTLAQFHFHSPSEHVIDGKHAPMEMHLVHKDAQGRLAVVGVLIQEGASHPELALLWEHLPDSPGRAEAVAGAEVNASKLLPGSLACYRYTGSLTTPPCSEDVAWFVLQEPIQASADQIAAFRRVIDGNNRSTQPLNDRVITLSR